MTSIDAIVRARSGSRGLSGSLAAAALLALAAACSSSSSGSSGNSGDAGGSTTPPDAGTAGVTCQYPVLPQTAAAASCASPGGAIQGANNDHCIVAGVQQVQVTGLCEAVGTDAGSGGGDDTSDADVPAVDASAAGDAATAEDAGDDADNGECDEPGYGVTNFGTSAQDDDCKYDVSWTSTPICENGNVYFTVTAKKRAGADGGASLSDEPPLTGASVDAEVVHSDCMTIAPNSGQTTVEQGGGVYKVGPIQFSKGGKWSVRFHFNECCSDDPDDSPHGHAAFWINVP
jgi:hypothetical protein